MERHGFIHDMLDVKILILYVMNHILYPADAQSIYELCYQDECLSYFDVVQALPQMVTSGHLELQKDEKYWITDEGKEAAAVTEDSVAYPVKQRVDLAVERFNRQILRNNFVRTEILPRPSGDFSVVMGLDDEFGNLMTLELVAPTQTQARVLERAFQKRAETLYQTAMATLLDSEEQTEEEPSE